MTKISYPKNPARPLHSQPAASAIMFRRQKRGFPDTIVFPSKRDSLGETHHDITGAGLARLRRSPNTELQFNRTVKCSRFWSSVETDASPLDTANRSQFRISGTVVFNILFYKTQTNGYHKRAEEKMTLLLILPKIYLLKCHLQENKTDTLSFLHLHLNKHKSICEFQSLRLLPSPSLWQAGIYSSDWCSFLIATPGKNRPFYYYPEHSGE